MRDQVASIALAALRDLEAGKDKRTAAQQNFVTKLTERGQAGDLDPVQSCGHLACEKHRSETREGSHT